MIIFVCIKTFFNCKLFLFLSLILKYKYSNSLLQYLKILELYKIVNLGSSYNIKFINVKVTFSYLLM